MILSAPSPLVHENAQEAGKSKRSSAIVRRESEWGGWW